jgi:DNA processing protein
MYALLRLLALEGLNTRRLRELLASHGSACAILRARSSALGPEFNARAHSVETLRRADVQLRWIQATQTQVLVLRGRDYPEALTHLADPPPAVFARGDLSLLERSIIAIVGTRRCTPYGADVTRQLATVFAHAGVPVLSGLARGIDGIAHVAAIEAGGKTIAVLGTGIDISYPREHRALQEQIAQDGLLLSEFAPGTPGRRHHFPGRNRIIAVLARGVVVVEAPHGSGALHTADHALDVGVDVFAVPGPIGRPESMGTNGLMRVGAHIATCAQDVLDDLGIPLPPAPTVSVPVIEPTTSEGRVLAALAEEALLADDLAIRIGLAPAETLALLLELEVAGAVRRLPGLRFAPVLNVATVGPTMG